MEISRFPLFLCDESDDEIKDQRHQIGDHKRVDNAEQGPSATAGFASHGRHRRDAGDVETGEQDVGERRCRRERRGDAGFAAIQNNQAADDDFLGEESADQTAGRFPGAESERCEHRGDGAGDD